MSGHSKWATTKRAKAVVDAKRGAIFTRLANVITIAAKEKGGDITTNFALKIAVEKAKAANMPKENIERSIKRGTGELAGAQIEELIYEGFGPAKSQFIVRSLTAASIRHLFSKYDGGLGSVMWNFEQKGVIRITNYELQIIYPPELQHRGTNLDNENFELELIDNGAEDIDREEEGITIYTKIEDLQKVKCFLDNKKIKTETAEIEYVAKEKLMINEVEREKIEKFIEELEDNEDVGDFYSNVNL
jgi:YebC/PmpR family DNA-binding regulatory protein